jgi:DNA polymerase type B, organellar and viral
MLDNKPYKIKNAYGYDVNAMYSTSMLNTMPVNNPRLSIDTNLDIYFGFCYVVITPPTNLKQHIIPYRDIDGNIIYPKNFFEGLYSSELLKDSLKWGYKIKVTGGFKFEKGVDIFKDFVNNLYENRIEAKNNGNNALALIYKLILNNLYGRLGMKFVENKVVIVDTNKTAEILTNKNVTLTKSLNSKIVIKYNGNIDREFLNNIRKIRDIEHGSNDSDCIANNDINLIKGLNKSRGTV